MRGPNRVEQLLCRFRRSELNCIAHFRLSNMQDGMKCLSCALDAEWVSKQFLKVSFVANFNCRPLLQGHGGRGFEGRTVCRSGNQTGLQTPLAGAFPSLCPVASTLLLNCVVSKPFYFYSYYEGCRDIQNKRWANSN